MLKMIAQNIILTLYYEQPLRKPRGGTEIHHLIWTGGVLDCFRGCDGAPCRGWIPAFAGMREMGDFGGSGPVSISLEDHVVQPAHAPRIRRQSSRHRRRRIETATNQAEVVEAAGLAAGSIGRRGPNSLAFRLLVGDSWGGATGLIMRASWLTPHLISVLL